MIKQEIIKTWHSKDIRDLPIICDEIESFAVNPAVIILDGVVGAGKTTFVKYFSKKSEVTSPSYSLINETEFIVHADFYRIQSSEEIVHLELELYAEEKEIIFIEWGLQWLGDIKYFLEPEKYTYYILKFEICGDNRRTLTLKNA